MGAKDGDTPDWALIIGCQIWAPKIGTPIGLLQIGSQMGIPQIGYQMSATNWLPDEVLKLASR